MIYYYSILRIVPYLLPAKIHKTLIILDLMNLDRFYVPPANTPPQVGVQMLCIPSLPTTNYNWIVEIPFVKISVSCGLVVIKGVEICPLSIFYFHKVSIHLNMFGMIMLNWIMCNIDYNFIITINLRQCFRLQFKPTQGVIL